MDHLRSDPFRLDGLALGAFLAVMARLPKDVERLARALPWVLAVAGGLLAVTFVWTLLASYQALDLVLPVRASLIPMPLACLLASAVFAPKQRHLALLPQPFHDLPGRL